MSGDELILTGGTLIDVTRLALRRGDLLLREGRIARISPTPLRPSGSARVVSAAGRYIAPGFIDSHLHIESSLLSPAEFARAAVAHGTTAVFVDPHEIANVFGRQGVELFLRQAPGLPLDLYVGIPSCVPATDLEDAGADLGLEDVRALVENERVYGLAEMMNFPAILQDLGEARAKVELVLGRGKVVDGHCPGLRGEALRRYVANGRDDGRVRIGSDHESRSAAEALEKRAAGLQVALRYGSASKDLLRILPGLLAEGFDPEGYMLCSDDLDSAELSRDGHVDRIIRAAREILLRHGADPERATVLAIALATVQPARYFAPFFRRHGLAEMGELAEGKAANLVVLDSLDGLEVAQVIHRGRLVVDGAVLDPPLPFDYAPYGGTLRIGRRFTAEDFRVPYAGPSGTARVKAIGLTDGIETRLREVEVAVESGQPIEAPTLARIAVIERHRATGSFAVGFVERCIARGALASTVAHDSHNLIVIGVDEEAMAAAVNHLAGHGGGMVVADGELTYLPLPIGGLMSTRPIAEVVAGYRRLQRALAAIGGDEHLFMKMSFLALPVIPELRITNRGLVDVGRFDFVPLVAA
jgi:adenine deaminase